MRTNSYLQWRPTLAKPRQCWANCAPPYVTPNHGQLWCSLDSNQGVCSDTSRTEMQCLRPLRHSGAIDSKICIWSHTCIGCLFFVIGPKRLEKWFTHTSPFWIDNTKQTTRVFEFFPDEAKLWILLWVSLSLCVLYIHISLFRALDILSDDVLVELSASYRRMVSHFPFEPWPYLHHLYSAIPGICSVGELNGKWK